ncbi:CLOCK-interacting pacemaker-like isoform X2 [Stegastes partitus]|uniref:CLOCK-interacting pacemaker-like n=1 Tax=Stegastes partitus TaxID=144197 RepID=A0A3B5B5G3_9TELE|nr:PREDICTED: CLOCK-interacting pacemaker-like isoform X2 [Stegastes partitus]
MPKEEPGLSERSPCANSSKNAKDKSNSTTLLAIRGTKDREDSSRRTSRCSSEKDSGYSDGSDWQHTDVEDQKSSKSPSRVDKHADTLLPGKNQELGQRNPGKPALMPKGHAKPPASIIKDMVLQQPAMIQRRGQLLWRNGIRQIHRSGSPHMLLLQQPSLLPANLHLHTPFSQKSNTTGKKTNGTYLPILNSYPRIAPHPSNKLPDKSSSHHETQNLSKRVCTEHNSDDTPVSTGPPEQHLHKQPKLAESPSDLPRSSSTRDRLSSSSPTNVSPSMSSLQPTSFLSARGLHRNGRTSSRHHRFLNTVEILRHSGLLDITLRTKELLHQSNSTEQDIGQLRQHTELLCRAASSPSLSLNNVTTWEHVYQVMAESGSYPNLKIQRDLLTQSSPGSATQPQSISTEDTNSPQAAESPEVPPSCLLTTIPHQSCAVSQQSHSDNGRKFGVSGTASDKVTVMPPDSSTG